MDSAVSSLRSTRFRIPSLLIWMVAALGVPFQFVLQSTPNVMIANLMSALHINEPSIGLLTSSFFYTYLLFQIPAGLLVDRFGARLVLSLSVLLGALACLLFAGAHSMSLAEISRLLMGLVTAPCVPAVMFVAAKRFSPAKFVILAGMAESIGMTGGAVGEGVLGEFVTHFGWRQTMLSCALVGVATAILMYCLIRDKRDDVSANTVGFKQILFGFAEVIRSRQVWLVVLFGGLVFALLPALAGLWIVPALQDLYHVNLELAALGSSALFLGTAIGLPFWGWLSEKIGRRKPVMILATTLNIVLSASFIYLKGLALPVVFAQLLFMGFVSAVYVLAFALVREHTSERVRASAMGMTNMMSMIIGAPLLQPLIGFVLKFYHRAGFHQPVSIAYRYALSSVLVCLILALVLIYFIRETYCCSVHSE